MFTYLLRVSHSSGAVWKSRWPSWALVPNKPTVSVDVKQHFNQSCFRSFTSKKSGGKTKKQKNCCVFTLHSIRPVVLSRFGSPLIKLPVEGAEEYTAMRPSLVVTSSDHVSCQWYRLLAQHVFTWNMGRYDQRSISKVLCNFGDSVCNDTDTPNIEKTGVA